MVKLCVLVAILSLLAFIVPVYADDPVPDDIQVTIIEPVLVANGLDTTPVSVTVYNQSNPVTGLRVDFMLNNSSLGSFFPESANTSAFGIAESTFSVEKEAGISEISFRVFYTINGTEYSQVFTEGQIEVWEPVPDTPLSFNTTKDWLVANGTDSCDVVIQTFNKSYPIPGLTVQFTVNESIFGWFGNPHQVTDITGTASSRFTTAHKSGNATLSAFITYPYKGVEHVVESQVIQMIDHDTPYGLTSYNAPSEMSVGSTAPIIMKYEDKWGNPIDDRRFPEIVTFYVSSPLEDARFLNTSAPYNIAKIPCNLEGKAVAWLQASTSTAINTVRVNPGMGSMPEKYFFIQGLANRSPVKIEQIFEPEGYLGNPPKLYADGISRFGITYIVTDEFGNGVMNTPVQITTTLPNEDVILYTNSIGQVMLNYGPKTSIGKINITASAIGNSTAPPSCTKEVWFISQHAENMQFTAIPDSMASRDVDGWEPAMLMAKVVDENGNPVEGETVTFSLGTPDYGEEEYTITDSPELDNTSAVTDDNGYAIVYFKPGGFTLNWTDPKYDDTASGSIIVTASWENVTSGKSATRDLELSWKNYPYLSIQTKVFPQTVNVSGTVRVQVRLVGDGWALRPKPIDAVLCTDRSGSMLKDEPDRMIPVMEASKRFTAAMHVGPAYDHIGLVSFGTNGIAKLAPEYRYLNGNYTCYGKGSGWSTRPLSGYFYDWTNVYGVTSTSNSISSSSFRWVYRDSYWDSDTYNTESYWPYTIDYDTNSDHYRYVKSHYPGDNRDYGDYAVVERHLTDNPAHIYSSIDMMVPSGGTPMRYGLYKAIEEIRAYGREKAIRAIILLSDGDYNYYGDPLARGTGNDKCNPTGYGDLSTNYCKFPGLGSGRYSKQNLSVYAMNNNIKIYSIGYAKDISSGGRNTLRILAESTGGEYYDGDAANITEVYESIAGKLREEAGVGTEMDLQFETIEVNFNPVTVNETFKVFEYVPTTDVDSYYANRTRPDHSPPYPYSIDQSDEFNTTHALKFSIGTVKLGQTWEASYTLRVLADGNINIFGKDSVVRFNGTQGPSQLYIPKTYITGVPEMNETGVNSSSLDITVGDAGYDSDTGFVSWPIYRNYTGNMTVKEDYYISTDGGITWFLHGFAILSREEASRDGLYIIDRRLFPPEAILDFRVVGNAFDAPGPVIAEGKSSHPQVKEAYIILR